MVYLRDAEESSMGNWNSAAQGLRVDAGNDENDVNGMTGLEIYF
jgi:hypothetical protein